MPRKKDDVIYLSPSSLQRWYECGCPAAWEYERQLEPKDKNPFAERGILVHAMLDGSVPVSSVTDKLALSLYTKLGSYREWLDLSYLGVEVKQSFTILDGEVMWTRRIDAIVRDQDHEPLIIDYKTTGGWKAIKDLPKIVPQTLAFPTPGYLYPPPEGMWTLSKWPIRMAYIVAPFRGPVQTYLVDDNDQENFLDAVRACAQAVRYYRENLESPPKVRGKHCLECPFRYPCYNEKGWRAKYTIRKGHK